MALGKYELQQIDQVVLHRQAATLFLEHDFMERLNQLPNNAQGNVVADLRVLLVLHVLKDQLEELTCGRVDCFHFGELLRVVVVGVRLHSDKHHTDVHENVQVLPTVFVVEEVLLVRTILVVLYLTDLVPLYQETGAATFVFLAEFYFVLIGLENLSVSVLIVVSRTHVVRI